MAEARGEEGWIRPPTTIIAAFKERRLGIDSNKARNVVEGWTKGQFN